MRCALLLTLICLLCPAMASADPDQTPPDPITDVTVATGKTTMAIAWTNTGDDGTVGNAESFQVRISSTTITSRHDGQLAASGPAGSSGSQSCVGLTGLSCNSSSYVAVFLKDDHNNWSALGTVAFATTQSCSSILEVFCYNLLRESSDRAYVQEDLPTA